MNTTIRMEKIYNRKRNINMKQTSILLLLFSWTIVCQAQTFIQTGNDTTVITEYNDGRLWAYRNIGDVVVGLTSYETKDNYGKYYQINIFIHNHGDTSFLFDPATVLSSLTTKTGDTLQLQVYTNETFQKKIKRSQSWAMALYGLSSGLNSGTAGYSTSYSTTYAPGGYTYTTITHHYNANTAYQANMTASYQMLTLGKMMENDRVIKEQEYLKMTSVHPDESIVGYMNIKWKKGCVLTVFIPVNSHIYSFDWDVRKKK